MGSYREGQAGQVDSRKDQIDQGPDHQGVGARNPTNACGNNFGRDKQTQKQKKN